MQERFTVYIDESGQAGIGKIRSDTSSGASLYMTLGAALLSNRSRKALENTLSTITTDIGKKELHCSKLNHYQLLHFARNISKRRMRFFGIISHKATLGKYKATISDDHSMYYNKCAQYLLERIAWFMEDRGIPPENLEIIFEKANVDYDKMQNLLWACQKNPQHPSTKRLKYIDIDNISAREKRDEPLLKIADLVAHALYKCVDKQALNFGIPEPRYLRELAPNFFGQPETLEVVGAGLYCVHSTRDLRLDPDVEALFKELKASPPSPKDEA